MKTIFKHGIKHALLTVLTYVLSSPIVGFGFIFLSIHIFGKPEFFSWQTVVQVVMVAVGGAILANNKVKLTKLDKDEEAIEKIDSIRYKLNPKIKARELFYLFYAQKYPDSGPLSMFNEDSDNEDYIKSVCAKLSIICVNQIISELEYNDADLSVIKWWKKVIDELYELG